MPIYRKGFALAFKNTVLACILHNSPTCEFVMQVLRTVGKIITVTRWWLVLIHIFTALQYILAWYGLVRYGLAGCDLAMFGSHELLAAPGGGEEDGLTENASCGNGARAHLSITSIEIRLYRKGTYILADIHGMDHFCTKPAPPPYNKPRSCVSKIHTPMVMVWFGNV
jgi:hypothetical protein